MLPLEFWEKSGREARAEEAGSEDTGPVVQRADCNSIFLPLVASASAFSKRVWELTLLVPCRCRFASAGEIFRKRAL